MKKIFSHENVVTFVLVMLACTAAFLLMPLIRKFIPWGKTSTTAASTTTSS